MEKAVASCLRLLQQLTCFALSFARLIAGRSSAARIAMITITISNSTSVNASHWQRFRLLGMVIDLRSIQIGYATTLGRIDTASIVFQTGTRLEVTKICNRFGANSTT